jgi:hypothetical protein
MCITPSTLDVTLYEVIFLYLLRVDRRAPTTGKIIVEVYPQVSTPIATPRMCNEAVTTDAQKCLFDHT